MLRRPVRARHDDDMLSVGNLTKTFPAHAGQGRVEAVKGVSFDVREGEFFTLLGPSGCGKTTTLQCIAGLEDPDSGEIRIANETVFSSDRGVGVPANRRGLGMVFQSYAIWPHMTVIENVAFPLLYGVHKTSFGKARPMALKALEMVELGHLADRPAPLLSGGQQQRVALARAIVHEPRLLLLDEPLSNLDAKLRETMRSELRRLVEKLGTTTIFVTHDQIEAIGMSDEIVLMRDGLIVQQGTPREICMRPESAFVAEFIGQNNLVGGRVLGVRPDTRVETAFGVVDCTPNDALGEGSRAVVVVHPRTVSIHPDLPHGGGRANVFRGTVTELSFLGHELEVTVSLEGHRLNASLNPFEELRIGQTVHLELPAEFCTVVPADPAAGDGGP